MKKFVLAVGTFLNEEEGPTAVEYAIMISLVILVCFAAVISVGAKTNSMFQNAASSM